MMLVLYLSGLTLWSALPTCTCDYETALAMKKGAQNYTIAIGANSYIELVIKSSIFIDKTLFIVDVLQNKFKSKLILCPRKWGKTMNLDMLKTYLEIEVDERGNLPYSQRSTKSYKLFRKGEIVTGNGHVETLDKPLLVNQYRELQDSYQSQYPVIYLSLKGAVGETLEEVVESIRYKIANVFNQHKYMLYVLKKNELTDEASQFERLLHPDVSAPSVSEIVGSLNFLSKILHDHFQKKVFVLLDDYDASFQSPIDLGDLLPHTVGELQDLFNTLLALTFPRNHYLEQGIAVGTFKIQNNKLDFDNNFQHYYVSQKNHTVEQYFGFSRTEVHALFEKFNVTGNLARQAYNWYYGHTSKLNGELFYNPWSIANFLKHKKITNYWQVNDNLDFLSLPLRLSSLLRKLVLAFISKDGVLSKTNMRMNKFQIKSVKNVFRGRNVNPNKKGDVYFLIWYLLENGYLVKNRDDLDEQARLPNNEVTSMLAIRLMSFYEQRYQIDRQVLHETAINMYQFIQDDLRYPPINESLQELYKNQNDFTTVHYHNTTEESTVHSIFNCLLLQVQCISKFDYEVYYNRIKKADYVVYDNATGHGAIIEITIDHPTAENALIEAEKHKTVFRHFPQIKNIKFIGINFYSNGTINVQASTKKKHGKINRNDTFQDDEKSPLKQVVFPYIKSMVFPND